MTRPRRRRPPRLLTVKQVAARLNCSEKTVHRLVAQGRLSRPRQLVRGVVRWLARDVEVYLYRLWRGDFEPPTAGPES